MLKKTQRRQAITIAMLAVILALTFLTSLFPFVFLMPLIIAAIVLGKWEGCVASVMFAAVSVVYAFSMPNSVVAIAFINHPWLPIVPRLPIGIVCYLAYKGAAHLTRNSSKTWLQQILPVCAGAAAAVITNTTLVVGCMVIFYGNEVIQGAELVLSVPLMLTSGAIELAVSCVLAPPIVYALRKTPMFRLQVVVDEATSDSAPTESGDTLVESAGDPVLKEIEAQPNP